MQKTLNMKAESFRCVEVPNKRNVVGMGESFNGCRFVCGKTKVAIDALFTKIKQHEVTSYLLVLARYFIYLAVPISAFIISYGSMISADPGNVV